jgi:hypothetical protein
MNDTPLIPEIEALLTRYVSIQQQEQALKEEKSALQERLAQHMERMNRSLWFPEASGQKLKVRYQKETVVEYDEEALRQRLGERYAALLEPDWRKIRRNLPALTPTLAPHLPLIGTPSAAKVREAVTSGLVKAEEFNGAFRKTIRNSIAVSRAHGNDRDKGKPQSADSEIREH